MNYSYALIVLIILLLFIFLPLLFKKKARVKTFKEYQRPDGSIIRSDVPQHDFKNTGTPNIQTPVDDFDPQDIYQ